MSLDSKQVSLFDTGISPTVEPGVETNEDSQDYLNYPGSKALLAKVQNIFATGKRVKFKLGKALANNKVEDDNFLCDSNQAYQLKHGCKNSPSGILLTQAIAGYKFIGDFSIAYIEAIAAKYIHQALYNDLAIDHFYFTEGIANMNLFSDCIKAHQIKKNNLAIVLLPENSIKAARKNRFSGWDLVQFKQRKTSFNNGKIYQLNKNRDIIAEINLVEEFTENLESPIYKVKLDERWLIVLPCANNYHKLSNDFELELSHTLLESIKNKKEYHKQEDSKLELVELEASIGQAVRVIFNLLGDYDTVPEALLNLEGGSWSALATESSASGRHDGSNSMHELIRNGWHQHPDIAIPWNYLSFEKISDPSQASDGDYLLALNPEQDLYLEADQSWKRNNRSEILSTLKYVYEQYRQVASKQFLMNPKEQMQILARYIASRHSASYIEAERRRGDPNPELNKYLEMIYKTHLSAAGLKSFGCLPK